MNGFDRIHDLHKLLKGRRTGMPLVDVLRELECSKATFFRIKRHMTDFLGAPIEHSRERGGYYYKEGSGEGYELPGVWFNEQELHALLLIQSLAANFGVLKDVLAPVEERFHALLQKSSISADLMKQKVRFLGVAMRPVANAVFVPAVTATLQEQRVRIRYCLRDSGEESERELSPQNIINYRNNWYMDAWCHKREALRTFSLECIQDIQDVDAPHKTIPRKDLNRYFQSSYGVYAGGDIAWATLRFAASIARRIADEEWHPEQRGKILANGEYELHIPFNLNAPKELIHDLMSHGPLVVVISPPELREHVIGELRRSLDVYKK